MTDIETARKIKPEPIKKISEKLHLPEETIEYYGNYMAKVDFTAVKRKAEGKIVLVTAINPTSAGEGKTTISIGLNDALRRLGINSVLTLREPSLGPVFGIKGGATGGGLSQVMPMENINLHFTGDFHAVTAANNLLCALIDNHIFQGNELRINPERITFHRCLDLNDRALRKVIISAGREKATITRKDCFYITAASEIMAILALVKDIEELKQDLGDIMIGFDYDDNPVYARDLKAEEAMTILLKDAIKPNLVQSLEHNPVFIHCGPFANIAHGCSSIIATDLAGKLADVVVTEAGFGADLGAEKFIDLKARKMDIVPGCVVVVATIRALKRHGGSAVNERDALKRGLANLGKHLDNLKNKFGLHTVVALNRFDSDTDDEINIVSEFTKEFHVKTTVTTVWSEGSKGGIELAMEVLKLLTEENRSFAYAYRETETTEAKIGHIAREIYGARDVIYEKAAKEKIKLIKKLGLDHYPVVIAKTQYSLTDNKDILYIDKPFDITVKDIEIRTGSKMTVVIAGDILLMPGLGKKPASAGMKITDGIIDGLF